MKTSKRIGVIVFAGVLAFGCATSRTTPQLNRAREAYSQARNDPTIVRYAPVPLDEAARALAKAQNAESEEAREHYAYVAGKKVDLAQSLAREKEAEDQLEELRAKREDILLQTRAWEVEEAKKEALEAKWELREQRQELAQAERETKQARSEIQQLRETVEDLKAEETEEGILLTFGDMLFATDRAGLKPGAELSTRKLAAFLKGQPDRHILIEGHTDSRGTEEYNRELSRRRAKAVAGALQAQGVSPHRMTTRGLGEEYPIAPNTTPAGRQQNRRVEILVQE